MLYSIEIENFKNFRDKLTFDLSETKNFEFNKEAIKEDVVNKAIIYGPNGSGKSNLGFAIFDIVSNITDKNFETLDMTSFNNYINAYNNGSVAKFKYTFKFGDDFVEYFYTKKSLADIIKEEVSINGKKVISYDREKNKEAFIELEGAETLKRNLSGSKISVLKYIKSNAILNDTKENAAFTKLFDFVNNMLFFRSLGKNMYIGFETGSNSILNNIAKRGKTKEFEKLLNEVGIECNLSEVEKNGEKTIVFNFGNKQIDFFDICSSGTQSLALFYYWRLRFEETSFVFIDEFDAFYHHELSRFIVEEIKKIDSQIVLTTHNTSIMTNDLLRPDCYFKINQNKITPLFKETKKELRKAHNIEKMYRAGVFDE